MPVEAEDPGVPTLAPLFRSLVPPHVFLGIAIFDGDRVGTHYGTAAGLKADSATVFRVASISKIVTGQLLAGQDMDRDASEVLGFDLRNPAHPEYPVTLAHLASHAAGLTDDALPVPPEADLAAWCAAHPIWTGDAAGTRFEYSNLGYILLAACAERLHGREFGALSSDWLAARGIPGGFNWLDVPAADRAKAMPMFRRKGTTFHPTADHAVPAKGLAGPDGLITVGRNVAAYAPQGGLRTSIEGLAALMMALPKLDRRVLWEAGTPEESLGGLFQAYGLGLQVYPEPDFYPAPIYGHFGSAYGVRCGVWHETEGEFAFAYALNGIEAGEDGDAFLPAEREIFAAIAALKE